MLRLSLFALTLLFCTSQVMSQCTDGCLRCNKIDENSSLCEICDAPGFYVPFGSGLCIKLEVENCEVPTIDRSLNKCVRCIKEHIFDTTTNTCKKVAKTIENCERYDSKAACSLCKSGFYLKDAACTAVPTDSVKANCMIYNTDATECMACNSGFYLDQKTKECASITKEQNCLAYTQNKCLECKSGYIMNLNYKMTLEFDKSFAQEIVQAEVDGADDKVFLVPGNLVNCQKTTVRNCATFETFDKCSKCANGYHLVEEGKKCVLYPQEPIKNCHVYSDATTCLTCVNGAYKSSDKCLASTPVEHCKMYSQSSDACDECKYGFYLDGATCAERTITESSNQCKRFDKTKNECAECNPNFVLNNAKSGCLAAIEFCQNNQVSLSNVVTCDSCADGYGKVGSNSCQKQDVENCDDYVTQSIVCSVCKDNFYKVEAGMKCLPNTVKNCKVKNKEAHECTTCDDKFYKDSENNNHCTLQSVPNCKTFVTNEKTCDECLPGFFKVNSGESCGQYTLQNCKDPNPSANTCDKCNDNYYPDANSDEKCLPQNRLNCKGYEDDSNTCNNCDSGYWLKDDAQSNKFCEKKEKAHCDKYVNTLENDNCEECKDGYYENGGNCTKQELSKCSKHVDNKNECKKCQNQFKIKTNDKTCEAVTVQNCATTNGTDDTCLVCNRGYYLNNSSCTEIASGAAKFDNLDANCTGNDSTTSGKVCNKCPANYTRFHVTRFQVDRSGSYFTNTDGTNCLKFNASGDTCDMCKEGYHTATPGSTDVCGEQKTDQLCLQKQSGHANTSLTVNTNCEKCKDGYYNNSGVCTERSVASSNCAAGHATADADTCDYCLKDTRYGVPNDFSICVKTDSRVTYGSNCASIDLDTLTQCLACAKDTTGGVTSCPSTLPSDGTILNFVDTTFALLEMQNASATIENCSNTLFGANAYTTTSCAVCAANKIMKVGYRVSTTMVSAGYSFVADQALGTKTVESDTVNLTPFANLVGTELSCHDWADFTGEDPSKLLRTKVVGANPTPDSGTAFTFTGSDKYGYVIEFEKRLIPIQCRVGHMPTYSEASWTSAADDTTGEELTSSDTFFVLQLSNCTAYSGTQKFQKRYEGLGYKSGSFIPLGALVHYDSCVQDSEFFFYSGEIKESITEFGILQSLIYMELPGNAGSQHCIPKLDDNGVAHTLIANCQVHVKKSDNLSTLMGTSTDFDCISCMPGYKPTFASNGIKIDSCVKIDNCDLSNDATNTYMNMCQTCKPGHIYQMAVDTFDILMDTCAENSVDNCLVGLSGDSTKCMLCENGYDLKSDKTACTKMFINKCTSYNYHDLAHLKPGSITLSATVRQTLTHFNAFMHYHVFGNKKQHKKGCNECETGYNVVGGGSGSSTRMCLGTSMIGGEVPGCEIYKPHASNNVCSKCTDDNQIGIDASPSSSCTPKTADETYCNQKSGVAPTDGTNCTLCVGFRDPDGNCYEYKDCEVIGSNKKCERCKEGFKPKANDQYNCEPIPQTDPCSVYLGTGECIKCKESTLSPVTLIESSAVKRVDCVTKYVDSGSAPYTTMFEKNAYVINVSGATDADKFKTALVYQDVGEYGYHDFMTSGAKPLVSVCLASPMVNHCKDYDTSGFRKCLTCEKGFKLNSDNFTCVDGTVDNCVTYSGDDCSECDQEFFLEAARKCTKRSQTNCKEFKTDKDFCTSCQPDQWYDSQSSSPEYGLCKDYTVEHCLTYTTNANTCDSCVENVRYKSGGKCNLYTKQFCKEFELEADQCKTCNSDRWRDIADTYECMQYTVQNCVKYSETTNECSSGEGCKAGFYLKNGNCVAPSAMHCFERNTTEDKCDSCIDGYWMNGTVCEENTAENCRTKSKTANKCEACLEQHYTDSADSDKCKPNTVDFCSSFSTTSNTCNTCVTGYFKNSSNLCEINTVLNCSQKSITANECNICNTNFYKNSNNLCEEINNETCVTITPNTNKCATCLSTRYNDAASGECKELTIVEGCMTYESASDKCKTCKSGFYKSNDSLSCFPNPNGILGCTSYSDLTNCSACKKEFYLSSNTCVELTQPAKDNCAAYSGDGICSACDATYSLDNGECVSNVATGCVTWADKDNCATCLANQVLNNGACENTQISGCAVTSGTAGSETCLVCDSDKFLKDNTCTASSTSITDCVMYSADGVCGKCNTGKVVSGDGSACIDMNSSIFGPHCNIGSSNEPPKCAYCGAGFLLDASGKCSISCSASNCMICDPNDLEKCNLCKTNYHMTAEMVCEENNQRTSIQVLDALIMIAIFLLAKWNN